MKQRNIRVILTTCLVMGVLTFTSCASQPTVNSKNNRVFFVPEFYTVQSGDSLSKISAKYGLNYVDVAKLNNIDAMDKIYVNQSIRLRDNGKSQPRLVRTQAIEQTAEIQRTSVSTAIKPVTPIQTPTVTAQPNNAQVGLGHVAPAITPQVITPVIQTNRLKWVLPSNGPVLARFDLSKDIKGLRFGGNVGDPIIAAADGEVVYADDGLKEYGKLVLLRHTDGYITAYAHNSQLLVKAGDKVSAGKKIAAMGNTGTTSTMMEFQVRLDGKPIDPAKVLAIN